MITDMKKLFTILSAAVLVASCNLNQFPPSEIAANDFIKDEASLTIVANGMYKGMHSVLSNEWAVTELRSNNVRMRASGSSSNDTKLIEELDQGTINSTNTFHSDYWEACYKTIHRANTVLANLDKATDPKVHAQLKGEAQFIRAMLYFNLVRLWGPVFIVANAEDEARARDMQRSELEAVYAFIESDLKDIVENKLLPAKVSDTDKGRAELDAAKVLLAKVYMTVGKPGSEKYAAAKVLLKEVLDARYNGTMVPYDKIFSSDNEMNDEIIFAVRYKAGNLGVGAPFSSMYGPLNNANNVVVGSPRHYNFPSDDLLASYEAGDLRKDVTVAERYYNFTQKAWVETSGSARFCNKYIGLKYELDPADPETPRSYTVYDQQVTANDSEVDFPVIRLADAMLLYAENVCETEGVQSEALDYVNAVRVRAGLAARNIAEVDSRYAFRNLIRHERRMELACENHHWYDLMRWGIAVATVNDFLATEALYSSYTYTVNPIEEWQVLLPIPVSVRNINPTVAQNPGY